MYLFFMYGRMQESGLIESILLIYTLVMWSQCPDLFHSSSSGIAPLGVAAVTDGCNLLCLVMWQEAFLVCSPLGKLGLAGSFLGYPHKDLVRV